MGLIADLLHTYQWRVSCWIRNLETNHNILARGNRWVRRCGPSAVPFPFLHHFRLVDHTLARWFRCGGCFQTTSRWALWFEHFVGSCPAVRMLHYIGAAFFGNVARPCGEVCKASGSVAQSCVAESWWSTCFSKTRCIAAVPRMLVPKANTIKVAQGMHGIGS